MPERPPWSATLGVELLVRARTEHGAVVIDVVPLPDGDCAAAAAHNPDQTRSSQARRLPEPASPCPRLDLGLLGPQLAELLRVPRQQPEQRLQPRPILPLRSASVLALELLEVEVLHARAVEVVVPAQRPDGPLALHWVQDAP